MPFVPGKSGNPNGRPKKTEAMTEILRAELNTLDLEDAEGNPIPAKQAIARRLIALAMDGDVPAMKYVYDRIDGRPKESIDLEHSGELTVVFEDAEKDV